MSPITKSSRTILKGGLDGLRKFLQTSPESSARFRAAPVLLIESQAEQRPSAQSQQVRDACRHVHFLLSQQIGLRTVVCRAPPSPATFCTPTDVDAAFEMASRVGALSVVAVGSATALDLAKALVARTAGTDGREGGRGGRGSGSGIGHFEELVLIPATYGGTIIAASSHALLVDPAEQAIVPVLNKGNNTPTDAATGTINTTIAALETNLVDPTGRRDAILASMALVLDAVLQRSQRHPLANHERAEGLLRNLVTMLASGRDDPMPEGAHERLVASLLETGTSFLSYGLGDDRDDGDEDRLRSRSMPLALAASLLPEVFPEHSMISVMASFAPAALHRLLVESQRNTSNVLLDDALLLRIGMAINAAVPPRIVTTASFEAIKGHLQTSQILWNCADDDALLHSAAVLREVLRDHVLVE